MGLYAVKRLGPLYLAATAGYAHFANDTDRTITLVLTERARGAFASDVYSARVETGWRRYFGAHQVTPFAGLQMSHLESQGFTEQNNVGACWG